MGELIDINNLKIKLFSDIKKELKQIKINKKIALLLFSDSFDSKIFLKEVEDLFYELKIDYEIFNLIDENNKKVVEILDSLNKDKNIVAILPIRPFPKSFDEYLIYSKIKPEKDIDCLSITNLGKLFCFRPTYIPSVVKASFEILKYFVHYKFNDLNYLTGKVAVIVGRSINTGRPLYALSLMNDLIPINLHSRVKNLKDYTILGDIVFACCGVPELIKDYMIKENSIIIDIGINKLKNGKVVGDVDTKSVLNKALAVTPVPGGVGEITKLMIIKNYILSYNFI